MDNKVAKCLSTCGEGYIYKIGKECIASCPKAGNETLKAY